MSFFLELFRTRCLLQLKLLPLFGIVIICYNLPLYFYQLFEFNSGKEHGPVVRKVDSAIHWINLYPEDNAVGFPNTYPPDGDLSVG